jgi:hypothetical protein
MPSVVQPGIRNEVEEHILTSQRTRYWGGNQPALSWGLFREELILLQPVTRYTAATSGVHGTTLRPRVTLTYRTR